MQRPLMDRLDTDLKAVSQFAANPSWNYVIFPHKTGMKAKLYVRRHLVAQAQEFLNSPADRIIGEVHVYDSVTNSVVLDRVGVLFEARRILGET